jgi:hypothetical protein
MAKDTYYFSHDYNARNDEKILELRSQFGAEGYGVFWMIVESMAENENGGVKATLMGGLSLGYGVAIGRLQEIIEACKRLELVFEKDGYLFSKRLLEHKEIRKTMSEYGAEGAKKRWGSHSPPIGLPNAKERKGKENKRVGVDFSPDKEYVIFQDGSKQELGADQKELVLQGKLKPHLITYGSIN